MNVHGVGLEGLRDAMEVQFAIFVEQAIERAAQVDLVILGRLTPAPEDSIAE